VSVAPECVSAFNELKLGKSMKWIIYKISDDWKEIVVEETSTESEWADFREKLLNAKSKDRKGKEGIGGRYAVFDVQYELESGEGTRYVMVFHFLSFCSWTRTVLVRRC
jgi:cofilin